jgi:ABC-type multidrug transport system ATPase subunit
MKIQLNNLGKRFRWEWIFRDMELCIASGEVCAIQGPNGSGKSTLLKVLSGYLTPSEGNVDWFLSGENVPRNGVFRYVTYAAPYIELIEEFSLQEMVDFHFTFQQPVEGLSSAEIAACIGLPQSRYKQIRNFSSGMKQRLKLGLAILTEKPLLLLDEPGTNLDENSHDWYIDALKRFRGDRTVIIASNEDQDFLDTQCQIKITDYK